MEITCVNQKEFTASVGVLPGLSCLSDQLSSEDFDHRRLAGTVLTDTTDAGFQGYLDTDRIQWSLHM